MDIQGIPSVESLKLWLYSRTMIGVPDQQGRARPVSAINPMPVTISGGSLGSDTSGLRVISDDPHSVGASAVTLTVPAEATYVVVESQDGTIRFRVDGTAPTATTGHRLVATEGVQLTREEAIGFRAVREGGTNVSIMATSYGVPATVPE